MIVDFVAKDLHLSCFSLWYRIYFVLIDCYIGIGYQNNMLMLFCKFKFIFFFFKKKAIDFTPSKPRQKLMVVIVLSYNVSLIVVWKKTFLSDRKT